MALDREVYDVDAEFHASVFLGDAAIKQCRRAAASRPAPAEPTESP